MNSRNLELDRLRAFAVIMTVVIHFSRVFFPWSISPDYHHGTSILNIFENSWTGVDLFFVISGYIISKVIVEQIDNLKKSHVDLAHYIKIFFIRRIYRIYPVAWLVFSFVLLSTLFFNKSGSFGCLENTVEAGISIFTYTFNYFFAYGTYHGFTLSPYWSLSVEEQFYILLPIFLIFTRSNRERVLIMLAILLVITFYIRPYSNAKSLFFTQTRCDGLIYGFLIYFLTKQAWFLKIVENNPGNKYFRIFITTCLIIALSSVTALDFSNNIVIPLGCIISSILVILAALEKNIIISLGPVQLILDYLGSRSYSLYLAHFPMFSLTQEIMYRLSKLNDFSINSNLTIEYTCIAVILTIISTEILHRFIEVPFINKGRSLSKQLNRNVFNQNNLTPLPRTI